MRTHEFTYTFEYGRVKYTTIQRDTHRSDNLRGGENSPFRRALGRREQSAPGFCRVRFLGRRAGFRGGEGGRARLLVAAGELV